MEAATSFEGWLVSYGGRLRAFLGQAKDGEGETSALTLLRSTRAVSATKHPSTAPRTQGARARARSLLSSRTFIDSFILNQAGLYILTSSSLGF
jgi:hypothetical protein